tara:strand:+ start:28543 stop:28878 length:336 start_codon:yes stop_codon:yes gene_type:complete
MSFEGYTQSFCKNGHLDTYELPTYGDTHKCSICNEDWAIENIVDDTNCEMFGEIPQDVLDTWVVQGEREEMCNLGHLHVVGNTVYKIPTEEEIEAARHYYHERDGWVKINP